MAYGVKRYLTFNPLDWVRQVLEMRRFVRSYRPVNTSEGKRGHFAVVVMPWLGTAVPWFSIASGLVLASLGAKVTFVVDSLPFGRERWRFRLILICIRSVLRALPKQFAIREIAEQTPCQLPTDSELAFIESLATLNTIWALRGDTKTEGRASYREHIRTQIRFAVGTIRGFLAKSHFDSLFLPGGVYGSSGVWAWCARNHQIRSASFDSGGRGQMILSVDGVASHLDDIPRAFSLLKESIQSEGTLALARDAALAEMARRRAGTDRFSSQLQHTTALDSRFNGGVLLALNSPWDTAALGLHEVFDSTAQWILETVRSVLDKTSAQVIVRQHPGERFAMHRSSDDYGELLRNNFGSDSRITFIAATDPINSYELLERVSVVVVYTSTIGVEAAAKGKVVLTASSSYYSAMGFVWAATEFSAYQNSLVNAAAARYSVTDQMKDDALLCYYLTQCCNWVTSPLSPEAYDDWIRFSFSDLVVQPFVNLTYSAVRDNVPVSFRKHLQNVEGGLKNLENR
jgi:hypothetical protein